MSHAIYRDNPNNWLKLGLEKELELIVDEAHALKSTRSVLFKSVLRQPKVALQLLTATPTSGPIDAYSYIRLKTPNVYKSLGEFELRHIETRDIFQKPTAWRGLDVVAKHLEAAAVKRTKEEVFGYDLTPIYQTMNYDLDSAHYKLYTKLVDEQFLLLPDGEKIDATTATRLYHAMQQIVCNWHEFSGEPKNRSAIYDLIDNVVEDSRCLEQDRSKLIIFTYYKRTSRNLLQYLNTKHGDIAVGAYSEVNSQKSIERFLNDKSCRILVGQPSSCGAGLNPAHLCSEVLFAEASTVPLQMTQACGRVDRYGQRVRPTIRFALANGTVQKKLYGQLVANSDLVAAVENKKSLRDTLLGL
jgi:SNF2 family DNA or RNA helicase